MSHASAFRGIQGIREVKARMLPLLAWYRRFKPDINEIIIARKDYDLLARWPKAANVEGFLAGPNGIFYEGLRLTFDTGQGRYEKRQGPEQTVIV